MTARDDGQSGLELAARLFAERCRQSDPEPAADFLRRHVDLHEWLEPMLAEQTLPVSAGETATGDASIAASTAEDASGTPNHTRRIGPYRLLRELGRGGMGIVYDARRGDDPQPIALKLLPGFLALYGSNLARFQREADLARRLDHPGIVRVLDAGKVDDSQYLAMEFVVGAPLDQVLLALRGRRPEHLTGADLRTEVHRALHLPGDHEPVVASSEAFAGSHVANVVKLAIQLAEALAHAHAAGVIHRDVKPSNLLVRADGTLVLTDLGLARDTAASNLTVTGDFAGTPHYVSPQQAMAKRVDVDHRTDLFSLGSTLYELLTLQRAFAGETTQEVLGRILTKQPTSMARLHPALPDDLVTVVGKLLEKDPDHRYRSANAVAVDLRAILDYRPVAARRASTFTRLLRWTRREPLRATLGLALCIAVAALTAGSGYLWARRDEIRAGREKLRSHEVADHVDAGFLDYALEDPDNGIHEFERALALDPRCVEAQMGLVVAVIRRDGPGPALQRLDQELAPNMPEVLCNLQRFQLLKRLGRDEEANAVMVRTAAPRTEFELFMMAMIHRDRGEDRGSDLLQYIERAVVAAERPRLWIHLHWAAIAGAANDVASCKRCAANLVLNWPDSPVACYAACIALRRADPEQAGQLVQQALAAHPEVGLLHLADGQVRSARGDSSGAVAALQRAVELAPAQPSFRYALGKAHCDAGDNAGALVHLRAACDLSPRFVDAWIGLGMALRRLDRLDESQTSLRVAVELHPNHAEAHFQLGQTLVRQQQLPAALVELEAATTINPKDPNKWHHLASARFALGDDVGGRAALVRAVEADPTYEHGHAMLVMYLQQCGTPAEARAALQAWVEATPLSVDAWLRYGLHCVSREMPTELRDGVSGAWAARRVLALTKQQSATAWYLLGQAQAILGQTEAARSSLQAGLDVNGTPLSPAERAFCQQRLRELSATVETASPATPQNPTTQNPTTQNPTTQNPTLPNQTPPNPTPASAPVEAAARR